MCHDLLRDVGLRARVHCPLESDSFQDLNFTRYIRLWVHDNFPLYIANQDDVVPVFLGNRRHRGFDLKVDVPKHK